MGGTAWIGRKGGVRGNRSVDPGCFGRLEPGLLGGADKNNPFIPVIRVFPSYTFDRNGNRLVSSNRSPVTVQPIYNGVGRKPGSAEGAD